ALIAKVNTLSTRRWTASSTLHGEATLDEQRVTQAVTQLAANAVAHTDPNIALELRMSATDEEVTFTLIDHGRGIPISERARIFTRFVQLHGRHDGSGLGLPIVAAIAAAHGGSIALADTPGGGSTFALSIPRQPVRVTANRARA